MIGPRLNGRADAQYHSILVSIEAPTDAPPAVPWACLSRFRSMRRRGEALVRGVSAKSYASKGQPRMVFQLGSNPPLSAANLKGYCG